MNTRHAVAFAEAHLALEAAKIAKRAIEDQYQAALATYRTATIQLTTGIDTEEAEANARVHSR